jgi:hypothetical protein
MFRRTAYSITTFRTRRCRILDEAAATVPSRR